ncbi:MucR family transcriptional regulator (plasmid) [Azospirillum sp. HJ39]|uniref:MucR family transcriptional regulator n=1 Tax=Azospirillum sp. HJ39 TaxID=3159496 RepID=UPI00355613DC
MQTPISIVVLTDMTAKVVAAYVGRNQVPIDQLPNLIDTVHKALRDAGKKREAIPDTLVPAVPIRKSVMPDYLVCLEDGKKMKMLKRHLRTVYNLSPEEYRAKWGLPPDYPMVAPNYASARSEMAKKIGLGKGNTRTSRTNTRAA